jgi:hypothetical protein
VLLEQAFRGWPTSGGFHEPDESAEDCWPSQEPHSEEEVEREGMVSFVDAFSQFANLLSDRQRLLVQLDVMSSRLRILEQKVSAGCGLIVPINSFAPEPFEVVKEIRVVIEESDGEHMAHFFDAGIGAQGCNQQEAVDNLKDAMLSAFDYLDPLPEAKLGPALRKQIAVLREYVRRRP